MDLDLPGEKGHGVAQTGHGLGLAPLHHGRWAALSAGASIPSRLLPGGNGVRWQFYHLLAHPEGSYVPPQLNRWLRLVITKARGRGGPRRNDGPGGDAAT